MLSLLKVSRMDWKEKEEKNRSFIVPIIISLYLLWGTYHKLNISLMNY